jgi:hypothetical protein
MPGVSHRTQGIVSSLDSGWGLIFLRVALFGALSVAILGGYAVLRFQGLGEPEAMEISHVARNLSEGHGLTTRCVRPFDIWYLQKQGRDPMQPRVPELHRPPAYPVLLSLVYRFMRPAFETTRGGRLFDAEVRAVVPLGVVLTLFSALAVFLVGCRLFSTRVAGLATVVYFVSNLTLGAAISGLPVPLLGLTVVAGTGLAVRAIQLAARGDRPFMQLLAIAGAGVCAGVGVLTDYTMVAVVFGLVVLLAIQLQRLRWVSVLLMLLVTAMLAVPWLVRNNQRGIGLLGAKPYAALAESALYPGDELARTVTPEFNVYRVARAIRFKITRYVAGSISGRDAMAGGIVVCFFILALFHRYEAPEVSGIKGLVLGVLMLFLLLMPLIGPSYNVMVALFPLVALLGVSAFVDYVEREEYFEEGMKNILVWALIIASAAPAVGQVLAGRKTVYPPYFAPMQKFVGGFVSQEEWICTDIPWATAWYGDRSSLLLPQALSDVDSIPGAWSRFGGVYLTLPPERPVADPTSWASLWHHEVPKDVPLRHAIELPSRRPAQIFLSDRPRWEEHRD